MEEEKDICIMIVAQSNDIENLETTINNLTENNCNKDEYIVVSKESEQISNYCKTNKIKYLQYSNIKQVYYELPKQIKCNYISFINAGDTYSSGFKEKLKQSLSGDNIYICRINEGKEKYILNKSLKKCKKVKIEESPQKIWIQLKTAFINKKIIEELEQSNVELNYYITQNFITKLITINGEYKVIKNITINSEERLEDSKESVGQDYDIELYKEIFENIKDLSEFSKSRYNTILNYYQYMFIYLIKNIMVRNANSKDKQLLKKEDIQTFYENAKNVLQKVNDKMIIDLIGDRKINYFLIQLKNDNYEIEYRKFDNNIYVIKNETLLFNAQKIKMRVLLMEYENGTLKITANYGLPFDEKKLKIYAIYKDQKIYAKKNDMYSEYKVWGKKIYDDYIFDFNIKLEPTNKREYIKFYVEYDETSVNLDIHFKTSLSKLSNKKNAYWNCGNSTLNYRKNGIMVLKKSKIRTIKREIKYMSDILKENKEVAHLRMLYFITKPFFRKKIWLFEDKIYKGGDNGEYMYTYSVKQKDNIKKYYLLNKEGIEAERFKKENKKFVEYGSLKHKLLFLNSNVVFETHSNVAKRHSFNNEEVYFRDIFKSKNVCLQHGLTVQAIPQIANRIKDNLKMYFLASPIEKENMLKPEYAYIGHEDILKITGCPRYDGLKNNDKRQILITPTWRNYLAQPSLGMGKTRVYNENFKKSKYFQIYNDLINNTKLIENAKKYNYKIIYLLHPCTSSQIEDYDKNEYVQLLAATDNLNYEKIMTESSLMVTDYSGVQFDFAYMYKPIVYFHSEELPPSYDEGAYKYETMALGEITKTSDELVDSLCDYMKNECKIKDEYKERIDKFFTYHDFNNCERIYNEALKL